MKCTLFENKLSEYLDGLLSRRLGAAFGEHAMRCRNCRGLMDSVKLAIDECKHSVPIEPPGKLETALELIPAIHAPLDCEAYQELITEFLDGFVPAATYHRFQEHAARCDACSALLTDVVYAVAACHGVHVYEDYVVPGQLSERLLAISPPRRRRLTRTMGDKIRAFADRLIPSPLPAAGRSFVTGLSLATLTFAFLLFGFSDDGTVRGIYRQAHVKGSELFSRGTRAYSEKDRVVAELEHVKQNLDEFWDTLGGDEQPNK